MLHEVPAQAELAFWKVICNFHDSIFKHEAANSSYSHTHTHTHTHTHSYTQTCTHPFFLQMPISTEQWRAAVGAANASRRPCQAKHRLHPWDVFMLIITALLVSTLLPGGGGRGTGSRREYLNNIVVNIVRGGQRCWNGLQHYSYCIIV